MQKKRGNIEKETGCLITWLVAETVANKVLWEKFEAKLGKGNVTTEHDAEFEKQSKDYQEYLTARAEDMFQNNDKFYKAVMGKGNTGRDYLYMMMYHWMGIQDERVYSPKVASNKHMYEAADRALKHWQTTKEFR